MGLHPKSRSKAEVTPSRDAKAARHLDYFRMRRTVHRRKHGQVNSSRSLVLLAAAFAVFYTARASKVIIDNVAVAVRHGFGANDEFPRVPGQCLQWLDYVTKRDLPNATVTVDYVAKTIEISDPSVEKNEFPFHGPLKHIAVIGP